MLTMVVRYFSVLIVKLLEMAIVLLYDLSQNDTGTCQRSQLFWLQLLGPQFLKFD